MRLFTDSLISVIMPDKELAHVPTRQNNIDDVLRQLNKFIGVANALMERFARSMEENEGTRYEVESLREMLTEFFDDASKWSDKISERIERLERLEILDRTGNINSTEARRIKYDVASENHIRALRQELAQQIKNLDRVKIKAARYGLNIPIEITNEIELFEERIEALRQELKELE